MVNIDDVTTSSIFAEKHAELLQFDHELDGFKEVLVEMPIAFRSVQFVCTCYVCTCVRVYVCTYVRTHLCENVWLHV